MVLIKYYIPRRGRKGKVYINIFKRYIDEEKEIDSEDN